MIFFRIFHCVGGEESILYEKKNPFPYFPPPPPQKKNRTLKQNFRVAFSFSLDDVSPQILFIERRARDLFRKINQ